MEGISQLEDPYMWTTIVPFQPWTPTWNTSYLSMTLYPSVPAATFLSTSTTTTTTTTVSTVVSTADLARAPLTMPSSPPSVASTASRRVYSSPKGTRLLTWPKLAASLQERKFRPTGLFVYGLHEWAQARNLKLQQEEQPFSIKFDELSVNEMDFWLSRFVLEVFKANGDAYPPNSLYQLVCTCQAFRRSRTPRFSLHFGRRDEATECNRQVCEQTTSTANNP